LRIDMSKGTESQFELTTIERLERLGYTFQAGADLVRLPGEVVLRDVLRASLHRRYPDLPDAALEEALARIARPDGVDTLRRNLAFHNLLREGFHLRVRRPDGRDEDRHLYAIDWNDVEVNTSHVVNQLPISGRNDRRPDILIYVNGLPLVLFELKNPYSDIPNYRDALNQIQHYVVDTPQLFDYNALCVVSDGVETLHGVWPANEEWYAPWKSIDGEHVEAGTTGSMKSLVEGLLAKDHLLAYVRDFIVFEVANETIVKKGAKYHQFFAVRKAVQSTLAAFASEEKRLGVIWHTTGSGKSLSMLFLIGILRREPRLRNPSIVIEVDRTDLDAQLHDQFVLGRGLVGDVRQAGSVADLRNLLQTAGGEVIFTTIEKFRLGADEIAHPVLSSRDNIIVIADEAHRSQYGFSAGYARYLYEALPNARRLGFTGTPVSLSGADTVEVFGDVIHTYDIRQSQEDRATVPIFYEPRQIRLGLVKTDVDAALDEVVEEIGVEQSDLDRRKSRWAALAAAAGAKDRLGQLAADLVAHFSQRRSTLSGKAMVVCMTRENCVRLHDALIAVEGCPEVKIVMTGDLGKDPAAWSKAGHITTKRGRDAIKARMKNPADPLSIVIVCDMWLTGTDIPCLHTLYIDKPMRGHNMIQAISRVNRVFSDKPHGLIVDYIGVGDELREATSKYSQHGGHGEPAPDIDGTAVPLFIETIKAMRSALPLGQDYGAWRTLGNIALEDLYALVFGWLTEDEKRKETFLDVELRLTNAFLLVRHLDACRGYADEVIFCQRVRKQLQKTAPARWRHKDLDAAVRDLVDDSVEGHGVVDIFKAAGIDNADISILDDAFLQTFKDRPHENLRLKLLEQLVREELTRMKHVRGATVKSFQDMLEATLRKYHNRLIDAAAVVKAMIEMRRQWEANHARAQALGLTEEELTFYDAVTQNKNSIYDEAVLRDLIHDVVQTIRRNLKVDWSEPHRDAVQAEIRAAVKRVLRKRGVRNEDLEPLCDRLIAQARIIFAQWPLAA
jgi:type I restriction enzyme R subunit